MNLNEPLSVTPRPEAGSSPLGLIRRSRGLRLYLSGMISRLFFVALPGTLSFSALAGAGAQAPTATPAAKTGAATNLFPDQVIARGTGFEIKSSELDTAFTSFEANLAARGQQVSPDRRSALEGQMLNRLILSRLLVNRATADDRRTAAKTADRFIARFRAQAPSEEAFQLELKALGLSPASFRADALERATCQAVLDREVKAAIKISDAAARKFYDDHPAEFEQPEKVRVAQILLMNRDPKTGTELTVAQKREKKARLDKILERARSGVDFTQLVKENSEDQPSKDKGGEYTFSRGQTGLLRFEAAAFTLRPGQISDVVESRVGYHIIKLLEKTPAKKVAFAGKESAIKGYLAGQEVAKQLPDYFAKLKKEAKVEILAPFEALDPQGGK